MVLNGKTVFLTGIEDSEFDLISKWHGDEDIIRNLTDDIGRLRNSGELRYALSEAYRYPMGRLFMIRAVPANADPKQKVPVGYIGANGFDWKNRHCSISLLCGSPDWVPIFGSDAIQTMCRYLNKELGIHRVEITMQAGESELYLKASRDAGFKQDGILRDFYWRSGKYHNVLIMSWMGE